MDTIFVERLNLTQTASSLSGELQTNQHENKSLDDVPDCAVVPDVSDYLITDEGYQPDLYLSQLDLIYAADDSNDEDEEAYFDDSDESFVEYIGQDATVPENNYRNELKEEDDVYPLAVVPDNDYINKPDDVSNHSDENKDSDSVVPDNDYISKPHKVKLSPDPIASHGVPYRSIIPPGFALQVTRSALSETSDLYAPSPKRYAHGSGQVPHFVAHSNLGAISNSYGSEELPQNIFESNLYSSYRAVYMQNVNWNSSTS